MTINGPVGLSRRYMHLKLNAASRSKSPRSEPSPAHTVPPLGSCVRRVMSDLKLRNRVREAVT
jgi:hypothetical protein